MMTTILLCVLLLLGIVWLTLGIAYSYERWRSLSRQRIGQRQEPQQRVEEAHELVARSKGLTTHVIPPFPVSSEAEESNMNAPTFAEQSAEEEGEEPVTMSNVEAERLEDEELDVDYTMEVIDEEEVLREELVWEADSGAELTSTSVLSRDLLRLSQWVYQAFSLVSLSYFKEVSIMLLEILLEESLYSFSHLVVIVFFRYPLPRVTVFPGCWVIRVDYNEAMFF